ncbi:hypothetical protein FIBSPDRAFT_466963 [Athelia psychrophila]|uniref:Uncharacterized protein n=1 Tax=Athelia psychrophila TaxID=1759441 RepID=A0A166LLK1_9AGAM|nr:hypothetical protein FIBSPDRAFT_466963 [Fibularhizoctonia sp. CBS 109695]
MLATTKMQIDCGTIVPRPYRCMRSVLQGQSTTSGPLTTPDSLTTPDPLKPSKCQPSAWSANPAVKKADIAVWGLIPVYTIWGAIIYVLSIHLSRTSKSGDFQTVGTGTEKLSEFSWAFVPNLNSQAFGVAYTTTNAKESASLPIAAWPLILFLFMATQSGLTLALHYCEAIINTTRDEQVWRQAASGRGVAISPQWPLRAALSSWRNVFLLVSKSFCHWIFGHSLTVIGVFAQSPQVTSGAVAGSYFIGIEVLARCAQVWYLSAVLVCFATITTLIAIYKPRGPQPAAYGHFQTLADLIDEWHPVLYWGHKSGQDDHHLVCHAGTSDKPLLQPVQMDREYAGELDQKSPSTAYMQSE